MLPASPLARANECGFPTHAPHCPPFCEGEEIVPSMLAAKFSGKLSSYLQACNKHAATARKKVGRKGGKKSASVAQAVAPVVARPVNLFHELGMLVASNASSHSVATGSGKRAKVEGGAKREPYSKVAPVVSEIRYVCNVCSTKGIYTGNKGTDSVRDSIDDPQRNINFHTWEELDEERLSTVDRIIQRATPNAQPYDQAGQPISAAKQTPQGLFGSTYSGNQTKDPVIPSTTRLARAYDVWLTTGVLKYVHDSVKIVKNKTLVKNEKRQMNLVNLYHMLSNKVSDLKAEEKTTKVFGNEILTAKTTVPRVYHIHGDLYNYNEARKKKKYAKWKAKQRAKKKKKKDANNIINMTVINNNDPLIETLINSEKHENLIGYLLGSGQLVKYHPSQHPYFKLTSNAYGIKIAERFGLNINRFNRGKKFQTHWLEVMDTMTYSVPNVFLTDISTQVGEFYSRKLSYRIYTEQDEMLAPLFRDFMRRERSGRGKTKYRKRIPDNIEKYLTPRVIAHWYLDKGDFLHVDDPSRRRALMNNGVPRSGGMNLDNEDDSPALLCLRVDNWKDTEDIALLQRGLKNKFGIDSYPSIISLDGVVASTTTPLTNFLLIEDHHTDKFVNLISHHLPSRIQQSLRQVTGDKISLDRIRYEVSSQQLLRGLRRSSLVGKSMQSRE